MRGLKMGLRGVAREVCMPKVVFLPAAKPTGHRIVRVVVLVLVLVGGLYHLSNYSLKYCLIGVCICFDYTPILGVFN